MFRRPARHPGLRAGLLALLALSAALAAPAHAAAGAAIATGENRPLTDLDLARRLNDAFVQVAETVSPSVVVVRVRPKPSAEGGFDHSGVLDFLPEGMRKELRERMERERRTPRRRLPDDFFPEQGSGVLIRDDGYILTNGHVVENADKIEVRLKDGRRFPATVRGVDSEADVAVLKLEATGLPAVKLGDSGKVRVGEFAIAIGAPFELAYSVTFGHISAKGRRIVADVAMMDQDFLQTDASINPGNSGGPLVNLEGEVIGINTMIQGMNTGIGFAVPINLAREVASQLIDKGRFSRAWLGVNIDNAADRSDGSPPNPSAREGVVVTRILREGPSWGSELEAMDVIVSVDGESVRDVGELKHHVSRKQVGKPITLEVFRGEKKLTVHVTPGELPAERFTLGRSPRPAPSKPEAPESPETRPAPEPAALGALGLRIRPLDRESAAKVGLDPDQGVVVVEVEEDGPAAKREIRAGDVITKINRRPVRNPAEFAAAVRDMDLAKGVPVTVCGPEGKRRYPVLKK